MIKKNFYPKRINTNNENNKSGISNFKKHNVIVQPNKPLLEELSREQLLREVGEIDSLLKDPRHSLG
jgi:hypothetical protein